MSVTLDQIKTLIAVANLKSFAAAAVKLNATQPGISTRIKKLESALGVELFTRTTRSVELTREGHQCVIYAERIIKLAAQMEAEFKDPAKLSGIFRIGVSDCIADTWLNELIGHLDNMYPDLRVEVHMGQFFSFINELKNGSCDLVLSGGSRDILIANKISASYLGSMEYVWMCSSKHSKRYPGKIKPEDLQNERILTYHRETLLFHLMEEWFLRDDSKCERWSSFDTTTSIASQTLAGLGIGLLPKSIYANHITDKKLTILPSEYSFPPLHSYAMYISSTATAAHKAIVEQAVSISNFPKMNKTF